MSVHLLPADQALERLGSFDAIIDARSEDEYALDHLPGAINWPSLNNEERKLIGTLYKQVSPFEAQKRGAALVAANIARHIEREVLDKPKHWQPLIYCWRGGKRSGSLALVLGQIGFRVNVVEGGYKAFRSAVLADLPRLPTTLTWRVICGPTGSGKTRLLHALQRAGAQVLDLEGLAQHRSSVLGAVPGVPQPSQKRFETLIWQALRQFDPTRPIFAESESKKVGNLSIPDELMAAMRASDCVRLDLSDAERVALLMEDYRFFVEDTSQLCARLEALLELRGRAVIDHWKAQIAQGDMAAFVMDLLTRHYDPGYLSSTRRNFVRFEQARVANAADRTPASMDRLAQELLQDAP